jgi:hypothetical protein
MGGAGIRGSTGSALGAIGGYGSAGSGIIDGAGNQAASRIGALSDQLGSLTGMFDAGGRNIAGAGSSAFGNMNSGLSAAANIPGMMNTAMRGIGRDGSNAFGSLRSTANQANALRGMLDNTFTGLGRDYDRSSSGITASMNQGYDALRGLQDSVASSPIAGYLMQSGLDARRQIDGSMAANNNLLSSWINAGLGSVRDTMAGSYGQLNRGMNQFYANIPRDGAGRLDAALSQGAGAIGSLSSQMRDSYRSFGSENSKAIGNAQKQADGIMDRTGVVTPAQRQQLAAQAKAAAMGRNNAEGKSQAEMMRDAREQEKKDREQWIKDNPYKPSGNASIDRLNKAWYSRR